MRAEEERHLKEILIPQLPDWHADLVSATQDTFAQPIYTVDIPAYRRGRICLVGDAGAVATPMTGSGVFKAMTNAMDLTAALSADSNVDRALESWDRAQTEIGQRYLARSERMERALMWETPNLAGFDAAAAEDWYTHSVA
jgi:2-polyprenyl-6-methoxyphenol hydroxylase-like FAD-dependent oxidoreductase